MSGNHFRHMVIGGAVVLATLLLVGVPAGTALTYALLLACPLMMVAMMFMRPNHRHVGQAVPTQCDRHRQIPHDLARIVRGA